MTDFHFRCNACGRCCNSPPLMSVPELFAHQHTFVGCIAITRRNDRVSIVTQGLEYDVTDRCPALASDGRCSIHTQRPTMCAAVPLAPALPDASQLKVLESRSRESLYIDADCISREPREGFKPLARGAAIVDPEFVDALARRRATAAQDEREWGEVLLPDIRRELLSMPAAATDGYFTIPLVPVLGLLAGRSTDSREWCLQYVDSQIALIDTIPKSAAKPRAVKIAGELRVFAQTYRRFRGHLA